MGESQLLFSVENPTAGSNIGHCINKLKKDIND